MNYNKIYNQLVNSRKILLRKKGNSDYYEYHHIVPKSMGGSNHKDNLVLLTFREHYVAHWLLTKMYSKKDKAKMVYAFFKMTRINPKQKNNRQITSKDYERAKSLMINYCRYDNAPFFGRTHTPEVREKLRLGKLGQNNPAYGKKPWNYGIKLKPLTKETKLKMSNAHKGKKLTEQAKFKVSKFQKNRPKSEEHKLKISKKLKGRKIHPDIIKKTADKLRGKKQKQLVCPHCNKSGGTTMYRWHFQNCKNKS